MKWFRVVLPLILFVALALAEPMHPVATQAQTPADVVPGGFIVVVQAGADPRAIAADHNLAARHVFRAPNGFAATVPDASLAALRADRRVTLVEPDFIRRPVLLENAWGVDRIDAEFAHSSGYTGSGIQVGVIDTGVDFTHPDLAPRCVRALDFYADPDGETGCGNNPDGYGHGSHVAGIIAAIASGWVIGVAPEADVWDLKVCSSSGSCPTSNIIAALNFAIDPNGDEDFADHLDVVNISLGSRFASAAEEAAINATYDAGVFVVAAAGNAGNCGGNNNSIEFPGGYAKSFAVGAVNRSDQRACFSSTGPALRLVAPGVDVLSTVPEGNCTLCDSSGYRLGSGTSMATPHVTGTVALIKQANGDITNSEVRSLLQTRADDLGSAGFENRYGYGLVNTAYAVLGENVGDDLNDAPPDDPPPPPGGDVTVTSCTPDSASAGAQLTVTVGGSGFQSGATVDFGARVTVQSVSFVNDTQLSVLIKVHPRAAAGDRAVTVTNPDGTSAVKEACFSVD